MGDGDSGAGDEARQPDVYLQPHCDDICFSLGALAYRRHSGLLLTLFPIGDYVASRWRSTYADKDSVTATRLGEDAEFARACGLITDTLNGEDAQACGVGPWNLERLDDRVASIAAPLLDVLARKAAARGAKERPWLFCPCGVGSHVDHLAAFVSVARNYKDLARSYRIGFYEDLHYASDPGLREAGLRRLKAAFRNITLRRHAWPLGDTAGAKLDLIRLYKSQFENPPRSLKKFTPAADTPEGPHEALWSAEPAGPF